MLARMSLDRRSCLLGGAACLFAGPRALAAEPPPAIHLGRADLIEFWRREPPSVQGPGPSDHLPGRVQLQVARPYVSAAARQRFSAAELALLMRRLEVARRTLIQQPSLQDPHGASVIVHINIATNDSRENIEPEFIVECRPVHADRPNNQIQGGRYYTPGEASFLRVRLNPGHELARRRPQPMQADGDLLYLRYGSSPALLLADQAWDAKPAEPLQGQVEGLIERLRGDRSWFSAAPGPAALEAYVGVSRHEAEDFYSRRQAPTYYVSRAMAALLMTDWVDLRRRMLATR